MLSNFGLTERLRRLCRINYRGAFEDFAFAYLFGDKFGAPARLPTVGPKEVPGNYVKEQFSDCLHPVPDQEGSRPDLFLQNRPWNREKVETDLVLLGKAVEQSKDEWAQLILRESRVYLAESKKAEIIAPHYIRDDGLLQVVPSKFIRDLSPYVGRGNSLVVPSRRFVEDFLRTVGVTHILNSWSYESSTTELFYADENAFWIRLPFATRANLREITSEPLQSILEFEAVVFPHVGAYVLERCNKRRHIIRVLSALRDEKPIRQIRRRLKKALEEAMQGRDGSQAVRKLTTEIQNYAMSLDAGTDKIGVRVGSFEHGPSGPKWSVIKAEVPLLFDRLLNRNKYIIRKILRKDADKDYLTKFYKIFPELK